jgi:hypothetical protein
MNANGSVRQTITTSAAVNLLIEQVKKFNEVGTTMANTFVDKGRGAGIFGQRRKPRMGRVLKVSRRGTAQNKK